MILRIAGTNHLDPTGRRRLIEWLRGCSDRHGTPAFVATECNEGFHARARAQRKVFRSLLRHEWPSATEALVETCVLSLDYEGDAHLEIYPEVSTLSLDECRRCPDRYFRSLPKGILNKYKKWLNYQLPKLADSAILARLSRCANDGADEPVDDDHWLDSVRDEKLAERIAGAAKPEEPGWAIAIVGRSHAKDRSGSMRGILERRGYPCEVFIL